MNKGFMLPWLVEFCRKHNLSVATVSDFLRKTKDFVLRGEMDEEKRKTLLESALRTFLKEKDLEEGDKEELVSLLRKIDSCE